MEEIRIVPNTDGKYGCSRTGEIYSYCIMGSPEKRATTPVKLSQYLNYCGYLQTTLCINGKKKRYMSHRIIAETWIPNPDNLPEVDHIDNNRANNNVDNLRWITRRENVVRQTKDFGLRNGLRTKTKLFSPDNQLVGEFDSLTAAAKFGEENKLFSKSGMLRNHKSKGYYVSLDENNKDKRKEFSSKLSCEYILYSPDNIELGAFPSKRAAARYLIENGVDVSEKNFSRKGKVFGYYVIEKSVETKLNESSERG